MKKEWANPLIDGHKPFYEPGDETGAGSAQGSPDEVPWDYETWLVMCGDYDGSDDNDTPGDWEDYVEWMTDRGWEDYIRQ